MNSKILIADDDASIRLVLSQAFTRLGFQVRATGNATTLLKWVSDGEGDLVLVAVVHEGAERKACGRRELERAGGEALGEGPLDGGWFAGVAGVDPVDVPVLLDGEDEADDLGAAGSDLRRERGEFGGEVLGFDGAGAAVADFLNLGAERGAEEREQQEKREQPAGPGQRPEA